MRPVERLGGVEGVVPPARVVDALDAAVEPPLDLLPPGLARSLAVVDHAHDRIDRPRHPLQRLAVQDRVLFHPPRAQLRVHVLQRADPDPEHPRAQIAEVLPGQRVRPEGARRCVWSSLTSSPNDRADNERCLRRRRSCDQSFGIAIRRPRHTRLAGPKTVA